MKKRIIAIALAAALVILCGGVFVFKDFLFQKNEIFKSSGYSLQLITAPPFEVKNSQNEMFIRKVQNYIENAPKEEIPYMDDVNGWKMRGHIVIEEGGSPVLYKLTIRGNQLVVEDKCYRMNDDFYGGMLELYNKMK